MKENQSFLNALKYRLMQEGRERQIADEKNKPRKPKSDRELVELVFQDLGWEDLLDDDID